MEYKLNKSLDLHAEIFIDGSNLFVRHPQSASREIWKALQQKGLSEFMSVSFDVW